MAETTTTDGAIRLKEVNAARERIGAEPYLGSDAGIMESLVYGTCPELVKADPAYPNILLEAKAEARRIADEAAAEAQRIAEEAAAEKQRIWEEEAEQKAEAQRIAKQEFHALMASPMTCPMPVSVYNKLGDLAMTTNDREIIKAANEHVLQCGILPADEP